MKHSTSIKKQTPPKRVIGVLIAVSLTILLHRVIGSTVDKTNHLDNNYPTLEKTQFQVDTNPSINSSTNNTEVVDVKKDLPKNPKTNQQLSEIEEKLKELELSTEQQENIKIAYKIGESIVANDGTTFGLTLAAVMGQESSYGINLYNTKVFNRIKSSLGAFQIHIPTARYIIEMYELHEYKHYNDKQLAYKLSHDIVFSAKLAGLYMKKNYNDALKFHKNPWRGAVSKYNGGWYNHNYINSLQDNIKLVKNYLQIIKEREKING